MGFVQVGDQHAMNGLLGRINWLQRQDSDDDLFGQVRTIAKSIAKIIAGIGPRLGPELAWLIVYLLPCDRQIAQLPAPSKRFVVYLGQIDPDRVIWMEG